MGLFAPAWMTENPARVEKAVRAVQRVKDQQKLAEVALVAPLAEVRMAAANSAVGQDALEHIVRESGDLAIVQAALHNLVLAYGGQPQDLERIACHPHILFEDYLLALQELDADARKRVIKSHLDHPAFISESARHAPGTGTKLYAVSLLTDKHALYDIAHSSNSPKVAALAMRRFESLYPERAQELREEAIPKNIIIGNIDVAIRLWQQLGEPRDRARFESKVVNALTTSSFSLRGRLAKEAVPLVRALTTQRALFTLAKYMDFENPDRGRFSHEWGSEILAPVVFGKLTDEQLKRLAQSTGKPPKGRTAEEWDTVKNFAMIELGSRPSGQPILEDLALKTSGYTFFRALNYVTDEAWLLAEAKRALRPEVIAQLRRMVKSEDIMVDVLVNGAVSQKGVLAGSPKSAGCDAEWKDVVDRVRKRKTLEELALNARDVYIRSLAARRLLEDFGCEDVLVLHNVCHYCGGEVQTTEAWAGTIEAHLVWKCKSCGRRQDQTILGSSAHDLISGDYYVFGEAVIDEIKRKQREEAQEREAAAEKARKEEEARAAKKAADDARAAEQAAAARAHEIAEARKIFNTAKSVQGQESALKKVGGYLCVECGKAIWPEGEGPAPCICPECGASNHDWHLVDNVIDYRDYSAGERHDECARCGATANYQMVNTW